MSIFNKIAGYGSINNNIEHQISDYLLDDENVIMAFTFVRDSVVLTNYGIYTLDVQGVSGKKVGVKFFPGKNIKSISFESASTFDLDVDIKISVDGNSAINQNGIPYNAPISFKVPKKQAQEAREIVKLVKKHYLCR
ncbi:MULTISPECIES: PH domain-containing protein [Romboutsia]|uniref:PH domain-containing protein n=1 Tax=Romboutsia TaxID=1501226 RepID=UPI00216DB0BE|nr:MULTISPECIES: PH domain-containing protein [Romboutsia]MCI9260042.1 PH domain-containing protein [Romboutsia sp.]